MIEASNFTFPRPRKAESRATGKLVRCAELMARGFTPSGHFHPPSLTNFKSHKLLKKSHLWLTGDSGSVLYYLVHRHWIFP